MRAEVAFRDSSALPIAARGAALSEESGGFWSTRPESPDLFVKLVDGSAVNGHGWAFVGSLSDRDFALTLTDAEAGTSRRYSNLLGQFASFADLEAFDGDGALLSGLVTLPEAREPALRRAAGREPETGDGPAGRRGACVPTARQLCLLAGRFAVSVAWEGAAEQPAAARAVLWSNIAGTFWFHREASIEVAVKMVDGRSVNGHLWLFATSLTGQAYTLRVTDTATGLARTYRSERGSFTAFGDLAAF